MLIPGTLGMMGEPDGGLSRGVRCNSEGGACLARLELRAAYNATATRMMAAAAPELAECPAAAVAGSAKAPAERVVHAIRRRTVRPDSKNSNRHQISSIAEASKRQALLACRGRTARLHSCGP